MKNLPKDKRDKLILVGLGTLALVAGLYYGLIAAQRNSLAESKKKTVDQEDRLTRADYLVKNVSQVQRNLEQGTANLGAIEGTMASGDFFSWGIQTVNNFKENYDIEIPEFSRPVTTEVGMFSKFPYKAVVFNLRGTARYRDFGRFVADFENAFPYMRIQNIELDPATASNATGGGKSKEKLAFKLEIMALVKP